MSNTSQNPLGQTATLSLGRSHADQWFFWLLVAATVCQVAFDIHVGWRRFETWVAIGLACTVVWLALQTYVRRTTFTPDRIEHRTVLGARRVIERGKFVAYESRGNSIIILGDDTAGKSIQIRITASDGNLDDVVDFLRDRIGIRTKSC